MQQQAGRFRQCRRIGVDRIAENRVAEGTEMEAQLVRTPAERREFDAAAVGMAHQHAVLGQSGLAGSEIDFLPGPVRPIDDQRQVDDADVGLKEAVDHGQIAFFDPALLKGDGKGAMRRLVTGHDHQPRGFKIEAVHGQCVRINRLHPAGDAVLPFRAAPGNREHAAGFFDDQQIAIGMANQRLDGGRRGFMGIL